MRANKLEDGVKVFRRILHSLLVNAVSSQQQVSEAQKIISTAAEYTTAMSIELHRRSVGTDTESNLKRSLELSAYVTVPKLEVTHRQYVLLAAMKFAFNHKNFSSALSFANRMLENEGSAKLLDQVRIPPIFQNRTKRSADSHRLAILKRNVNGIRRTASTSSMTNSPSSTFVQLHILPSTMAHRVSPVRSTARNITPSTRGQCAGYAKSHRLALPLVG